MLKDHRRGLGYEKVVLPDNRITVTAFRHPFLPFHEGLGFFSTVATYSCTTSSLMYIYLSYVQDSGILPIDGRG